ncbi:MAG TPA: tRNA (adenosine(37)-N6)-threonylcarbamoyltransferase complex ATPase subunit type 1 TsaE [Desulfotomaculum sp.]|nr:tRNA (adenosine(37)-N6)-threonylcarbamoyltransferase complex ATPase subunit type 1 TsaE [Desulfotomaculum sp.]
MDLRSKSAQQTFFWGELLGDILEAGAVICLSGGLGAGKTVFAKGLGKGLGVRDIIDSPTFTIIKEYQGRVPFYHLDAYRLKGPAELADIGCEEYFDGNGVTLVEWADQVAEALPQDRLDITIFADPEADEIRVLSFAPRGEWYCRLMEDYGTIVRSGN